MHTNLKHNLGECHAGLHLRSSCRRFESVLRYNCAVAQSGRALKHLAAQLVAITNIYYEALANAKVTTSKDLVGKTRVGANPTLHLGEGGGTSRRARTAHFKTLSLCFILNILLPNAGGITSL